MENLHLSDLAWIGAGLVLYLVITSPLPKWIVRQVRSLRGHSPARRRRPPLPRRVMSRPIGRHETPALDLVSIPVSRYAGMTGGMDDRAPAAPDIDAENTGMEAQPPTRDIMSDEQFTALLARQKLADGKYRLSANKIFEAVGGDRNTVLAQVKAVRSAPPSPAFRQEDGELAPASYPVTQRRTA